MRASRVKLEISSPILAGSLIHVQSLLVVRTWACRVLLGVQHCHEVVSIVVIYGACIFVFLLMSMIVAGAQWRSQEAADGKLSDHLIKVCVFVCGRCSDRHTKQRQKWCTVSTVITIASPSLDQVLELSKSSHQSLRHSRDSG
eukprot:5388240-Amphidinium_carterae.1